MRQRSGMSPDLPYPSSVALRVERVDFVSFLTQEVRVP